MFIISQAPNSAVLTATAAATSAFTVIAGEPGAGNQNNLNASGSNRLNGQPFIVRAAGYVTYPAGTYTASTIQVALFGSNTASFTAASGNQIASLTALTAVTYSAATAATVPWEIEVQLQGDAVSKILGGTQQGMEGTSANAPSTFLAIARTAAANALTTFNPANEPPVQFAAGVVVGGANPAGTTATLTSLLLEA